MASAAGVQLSIPKSLRIRVNHSTNSKRHLLFKFFTQDGPIGPTVLYAVSKHEISRTQICRDTTIGCAKSSQIVFLSGTLVKISISIRQILKYE